MTYKVEFLPRDLVIESKSGLSGVAASIERIINSHAANGRRLDQVASISIEERPGCLGSLLGQKATYAVYNMLVFRDGE
jgi:hypothetical protein